MQQRLLAFKFFEEEHDGKSLSKEMIAVLLEFGIADRLLGVTLDNASNNTTMLLEVHKFYNENYPDAGFSVAWCQVECLAHVINLGAQVMLRKFKMPVDTEDYTANDSSD